MQQRVRTLVEAARKRNIETIAERVEDANTMAVLWQLGVQYIQGYFVQRARRGRAARALAPHAAHRVRPAVRRAPRGGQFCAASRAQNAAALRALTRGSP